MSLRSKVLPALYNGVSQQPPIMRSIDQNEDELNTWSVLADGVGKRPPTELVAHLGNISDDAFIHHINRDVGERYIVVIDGGQIKVYDHLTGEQKTVNAPEGYGYLADGDLRAMTVADYTFIVNANKQVLLADVGADTVVEPDTYRFPANGIETYEGDSLGPIGQMFAGALARYRPNPTGGYAGSVASIEKLPENAPNGAVYAVVGSQQTGFVTFYVRRNGGVWDETVGLGLRNRIDATTMPHCLIREGDGTFTFAPFSWAPRRVGDYTSNPQPSFVGRTIRDVFFYQNRLGFLSDENAIVSCAGDFGNFWRNTVLDYIDADVVDMAIATRNVAILNHALPFNDGVLLMADQTQFSLTNGEDGLTPSSVAINPVTNYEVNTKVRPVNVGTEVYFCGNQNAYSTVWEYSRMQDAEATSAAEVTAHCPAFLPKDLTKLISGLNQKALFALTGTGDVFVYQFYWNGNEKLMSAWRKWHLDGTVIGGEYLGGYLYLLIRRGTEGVFLERIHLDHKSKPAEQNHQVYLDRRVALTGVYNPVADRTVFTLPYEANQTTFRLVRGKTHPTRAGSLMDPSQYSWTGNLQVSVPGNETEPATGGEVYTMRLQFSEQFPMDYQGRNVTTGRLQLRTFTINYTDTAFFTTEVRPYGAAGDAMLQPVVPAKLADFTGKIVGEEDLRLNSPAFHTGAFSFQIYGHSKLATVALVNDTHVGSTFVSAQWEGFYFNRTG